MTTTALLLAYVLAPTPQPASPGPQPGPPAAADDAQGAKEIAARFFGVSVDELVVGRVLPPDPAVPWGDYYWLGDCRIPRPGGGTEGVSASVDAAGWYVSGAIWRDRLVHPDRARGVEPATKEAMRRAAVGFARTHFPRWSRRMRLAYFGVARQWEDAKAYRFLWRERLQGFDTGTYTSVEVTGYGEPQVYSYSAHIAPYHSLDEVRITRQQAIRAALPEAQQQALAMGLGKDNESEPLKLVRVEGNLAGRRWHEGPMWVVSVATVREIDPGTPYQTFTVYVDAVKGGILRRALPASDEQGPAPERPPAQGDEGGTADGAAGPQSPPTTLTMTSTICATSSRTR